MKKFGALIICLLMLVTCFAMGGCAGISINEVKYYNEVLATVGETNITRYDLLTTYNNYGYTQYVTNQGKSEKEALSSTLDFLIDQEALYQYALDYEDKYKPSAYQVNSSISSMFTSIDTQIEKYKAEAKNILNIESTTTPNASTTDDAKAYPYSSYVYKKRAKLVTDATTGEAKIVYNIEEDPTTFDNLVEITHLTNFKTAEAIEAVKTAYFAKLKADLEKEDATTANSIYAKVRTLLTKDILESEKYLRDANGNEFNKETEATLTRYFERVYNENIKSLYIQNIETVYMKSQSFSITELVNGYRFLVDSSEDQYTTEEEYKKAMKDAGTGADSILYHPASLSDGTEFGYFIHSLFKFNLSEDDQNALNTYKETDRPKYESMLGEIKVTPRSEDGTIAADATPVTINEIIAEYNLIKREQDYAVRLEKFIQFMFKYTEDTATLAAGMPYVIGTNGYSAMETAFTDESLKLMKQEKGAMSSISINDVDNRCITSYGIHVVFYVGSVKDFYLSKNGVTIEKLYNTTLNPLTHETYFDMMFDTVYPSNGSSIYATASNYQDFEASKLLESKAIHQVVKNQTRINATKTSL